MVNTSFSIRSIVILRFCKMKVYIVVRRNNDMKNHMVEIKGICNTRELAMKMRQSIWDVWEIVTEVEEYLVQEEI